MIESFNLSNSKNNLNKFFNEQENVNTNERENYDNKIKDNVIDNKINEENFKEELKLKKSIDSKI